MRNLTYPQRISTACHECGVLAEIEYCDREREYACPRCKSTLYRSGESPLYVLSAAFSALIFLIPTLIFPIMTIHILDISQSVTLIQAAWFFTEDGYPLVAVTALAVGLLIPIAMLGLILFILGALRLGYGAKEIYLPIKTYSALKSWSMAEVYLLSIFVSIAKLQGMATLDIELGLIAFVFFLITFYVTTVWFNPQDLWWNSDYLNR